MTTKTMTDNVTGHKSSQINETHYISGPAGGQKTGAETIDTEMDSKTIDTETTDAETTDAETT
ncbi:uncharacterized, partial [Tachysurus ichikawai]